LTALAHHLFLPGRRLHLDCQPLGSRGNKEIAPMTGLEKRSLARA
jgi:hypothetical protein